MPASLVNHLAVTILIICFTVFIFHRRLSVYFVVAFFPFFVLLFSTHSSPCGFRMTKVREHGLFRNGVSGLGQ